MQPYRTPFRLMNMLACCLFTLLANSAHAQHDELIQFMQQRAEAGEGSGSVAMITVDGEVVFHEAVGHSSLSRTTPLKTNAIFNIHSMTKPITSVAVMQCVEDGLLTLDDPVGTYLPAWREVQSERPITIRDLLTHVSGLGYGPLHDKAIAESANLAQYADKVAAIPLEHEPGERFTYGVGPAIAGRVIEVVRNQDLQTVVRERILQPLEMTDTGWELSDPERLVSRAFKVPEHRRDEFDGRATVDESERRDLAPTWVGPWEAARARGVIYGDGGMFSTAQDYSRFAMMMNNRGELDGARILQPETVDMILQDHLSENISYGQRETRRFGLGFEIEIDPETGTAIPGEHGWSGAASTFYIGNNDTNSTAIFMNATMPFDGSLKQQFSELARRRIEEDIDGPIVQTNTGRVQGRWQDNGQIAAFKGIPYAAPPIGELRWKPPQPAEAWEGIRPARKFGAICYQQPGLRGFANRLLRSIGITDTTVPQMPPMSEDCLSLNVWTPNLNGEEPAPVLVWIHGGGHRMGSGAFDGSPICKEGIVSVSFNMRLGVFGFFSHPSLSAESPTGTSGNQGLQDVIAVLEWVRDNIANFGGNPDRVILGGLSAGAGSAAILLAAPAAQGLFHGVFSVSPAPIAIRHGLQPGVQGQYPAHQYAQLLAGGLGLDPDASVEELRAVDPEQLVIAALSLQAVVIHLDAPFSPKVDGHIIPEPVFDRFASGKTPKVPLIIGAGTDEASFVSGWLLDQLSGGDFEAHVVRLLGPEGAKVAARYPRESTGPVSSAIGQFSGDWIFVANTRATADAWNRSGRPAWLYHSQAAFPEHHPGRKMGAFHGYAFDNGALNIVEWDPEGIFDALTDRMSRRLAAFAHTGDPNVDGLPRWEPYDRKNDAYLLLDLQQDIPSHGLRPEDLDPLQKAIETRGH